MRLMSSLEVMTMTGAPAAWSRCRRKAFPFRPSELNPPIHLRRHRRFTYRGCSALQDMPQFAGFTARTLARIATDLGLQLDDVDELVGLAAQLIGDHRGVVLRWWKPR